MPSAGQKRGLPSDFDDSRVLPDPVVPSTADHARVHKKLGSNFQAGRPLSSAAIPLALFDPIFGQFADDVRNHRPTESENRFAAKLRRSMTQDHETEGSRVDAFRESWGAIHEDELLQRGKIKGTPYTTDGHYQVDNFYAVITEGKNEITGISSDPVLQASMYYIASLKAIQAERIFDLCPCFIIYYVGT